MVKISTPQERWSRITCLDFVQRFAQPNHDAGFGQDFGIKFFRIGEGRSSPVIVVLWLDLFEEARHGFDIVIQYLRAGIHHDLEGFEAAFEIGDEDLDGAARVKFTDAPDDHGKDGRAAVTALIAVDGGDHRMVQVHGLDRLGDPLGLFPVQGRVCRV